MPVLRRRLAALTAAALLAAPTAALGQSAGDEQYQDPFAGEEQGQSQEPAPEPATPAPQEPAPAAPAPAPETAPAPAPQEPGAQPAELPRTGLDAGSVLAIGAVLLAGGVVLRLHLRERA